MASHQHANWDALSDKCRLCRGYAQYSHQGIAIGNLTSVNRIFSVQLKNSSYLRAVQMMGTKPNLADKPGRTVDECV